MGKRRGLHSRYYHTVLSIFDGVVERAPARGIALLAQLHAVATSRLHNIILNPPLRLRSVTFHRIANDGTTPKDTQASRHTAMETSNDPPHSMPLPSLSANAQGDSTSNHRDKSRSETNVETSRPSYSSDNSRRHRCVNSPAIGLTVKSRVVPRKAASATIWTSSLICSNNRRATSNNRGCRRVVK